MEFADIAHAPGRWGQPDVNCHRSSPLIFAPPRPVAPLRAILRCSDERINSGFRLFPCSPSPLPLDAASAHTSGRTFAEHAVRRVRSLDGFWTLLTPCEGTKIAPAADASAQVRDYLVPSVWESIPGLERYRGQVVACLRFNTAGEEPARLVFRGVSHTARVFLDGCEIGATTMRTRPSRLICRRSPPVRTSYSSISATSRIRPSPRCIYRTITTTTVGSRVRWKSSF